MPSAAATLLIIVALLLVVVLAMLVALLGRGRAAPTTGGGERWPTMLSDALLGSGRAAPATGGESRPTTLSDALLGSGRAAPATGGESRPTTFSDALLRVRLAQTDAQPPPQHVLERRPRPVVQVRQRGGGQKKKVKKKKVKKQKAKKARKPWTEYETWEALFADEGAKNAYWQDSSRVLNDLDLDWTDVRAELADKIYDNREWAGRINLVAGKPKIIELVPSPHAIGEGPLPVQALAMVPGELIAKLEAKPGLFMFHTHPGLSPGSAHPSAVDIASAMHMAFTGHYAADLVVSPYGVFMYTPNAAFRRAVWTEPGVTTAADARLALYRRTADLLAGLEGSRSWKTPWVLNDFIAMVRRYDVDYVVFPSDKYARADRRQAFSTPPQIDHETLHTYHDMVQELEAELAAEAQRGEPEGRP